MKLYDLPHGGFLVTASWGQTTFDTEQDARTFACLETDLTGEVSIVHALSDDGSLVEIGMYGMGSGA